MTTPTLEQMVETLQSEFRNCDTPGGCDRCIRAGLTAVIEKHIGPPLAEAFMVGAGEDRAYTVMPAKDYAARIIAQMKEPS